MKLKMKKDDAVSNVIGEMLLLAIALVLAAVFAASAFSFLPGEDEDAVDISVNITKVDDNNFSISFYHKGGDWIRKDDLRCSIYRGTDSINTVFVNLTNSDGVRVSVFDLGCCLEISAKDLQSGDDIKLYTPRSVIYSGKIPWSLK